MSVTDARIPRDFAEELDGREPDELSPADGVSGRDWLAGLPRTLDDLLDEWRLTPDGATRSGVCAVVLPVRTEDGGAAALKVTWPHLEARTEHLALRRWDGDGAVRLLRADPHRFALLLERLEPQDLSDVWVEEACDVVGGLLARLDVPAIARVPRLGEYAARQAAAPDSPALPPRYGEQARHLASELASGLADRSDERLLHTDLHYANVLAGERAPWLAIDPKPMAGDRAFEVAPLLWNRADADELGTGPAIRWSLRRRVEVVCAAAGIDEARARAWAVVRVVDWARDETPGSARAGLAVSILKAMND